MEVAHGLGEKAWDIEFAGCLGHEYGFRPQYATLGKVFERLENPQSRIIDEFFWFWPSDSSEEFGKTTSSKDIKHIRGRWLIESSNGTPRMVAIAKHNLAIDAHLRGIFEEQKFLDAEETDDAGSDALEAMNEMWKASLNLWKEVLSDDEVWKVLEARISSSGDQRIPADFLEQFRDELPHALKRVNMHFAVNCIELMPTGLLSESKDYHNFRPDLNRHLQYMQHFFPVPDDVVNRAIFGIINQRFENIVHYWTASAEKSPKYAIGRGLNFLGNVKGYQLFAEEHFGKGHPDVDRMCNRIAELCNHCAVLGVTHGGSWKDAITLLQRITPIVQSPSLRKTVQDNLQGFQNNLQSNTCWFCHKQGDQEAVLKCKLYAHLQTETKFLSPQYRTTWRTVSIDVPRCRECAKRDVNQARLVQYPPIAQKLREGYLLGDKPTEEECKLHYMMTQKALLWKESSSWSS